MTTKQKMKMTKQQEDWKKKVIWVEIYNPCCEYEHKSQEELLKENALMAEIWLADAIDDLWGDDWNDAPACCNAGSPYRERIKGLKIIKIRLGNQLIQTLEEK